MKKQTESVPRLKSRFAKFLAVLAVLATVTLSPQLASAQGCIVARSDQLSTGPGYLEPHHWELTIDYRHQYSFRHYIGDVEQTQRIQQGTEVENRINLQDFFVTYQLTPRWSLNADLPLLFASRRSANAYNTFHANGFGDITVGAQTWIFNPKKPHHGNVQIGYGLLMPTGASEIRNTYLATPTATKTTTRPVDYSIQPGIGGWGIALSAQAFRAFGKQEIYGNGSYLITPQNQNTAYLRNPTATTQDPLNQYNSISDEYLVETGIGFDIPQEKIHGLEATFGPRFEGVPAHDLIGDNLGFRRPGFALSLEPGVRMSLGNSLLTASVGRAIWRARVKSVPDMIEGAHGDAAFADWVWSASFTHRF